MAKPFPTFELSRKPTLATWKDKALKDTTLRTDLVYGGISTRATATKPGPRHISFTYNLLIRADKDLIEAHEDHVMIGAAKFAFRESETNLDWEVRFLREVVFAIEPELPALFSASIEFFGYKVEKMRTETYWLEDLGAGDDIASRPFFVNPKAVTVNSIVILTQGASAGVDDSNTVVIEIKDDAANSLVSKTYDTDPQPPDSDYADLGTLSNASLAAGEHLNLNVTQGATANMPAFGVVIEYYFTP